MLIQCLSLALGFLLINKGGDLFVSAAVRTRAAMDVEAKPIDYWENAASEYDPKP